MGKRIKMRARRTLPVLGVVRGQVFTPPPQVRLDLLQRGWGDDLAESAGPVSKRRASKRHSRDAVADGAEGKPDGQGPAED